MRCKGRLQIADFRLQIERQGQAGSEWEKENGLLENLQSEICNLQSNIELIRG
jgi:hypothetical protein